MYYRTTIDVGLIVNITTLSQDEWPICHVPNYSTTRTCYSTWPLRTPLC